MRMTKLFSHTLRDIPSEADVPSHQLLLRAGYIRGLAAGIFSYLPLAKRTITKIENIIREEIEAIGGQEITMPVVHPAEIWKETGRWYKIDAEMGRFKDRSGRDMVLAMTHEEVVADLVRKVIQSYKQLPSLLYHIQTKWRDDPRPRAGLIRAREFTMKDSYSLDADWDGLETQYRAHYQAYFNIFNRCGVPVVAVKSDTGMMSGKIAHEFIYLNPIGEDTILICETCGYAANRQIATFKKLLFPKEDLQQLEKVATPGAHTIAELAAFLHIPETKTAKAVLMMATIPEGKETTERFIFAVLRGDMEMNETKLANALNAKSLRPATEEEILSVGAVPGFASPIGLSKAIIVVDDAITKSYNLVAGANDEGYHFLNVNYGRDYQADIVADIAAAREGDACPLCGSSLTAKRGIEVGNIFQLGTFYSEALGCTYLDANGKAQPVVMGSYGIGVGRLLACAAEAHHDDFGLILPITIAPYQIHLIALSGKGGSETLENAEKLYADLLEAGFEVLYDDRNESPGVKFNDADLIGIPIRLTVSKRAMKAGGIEFKRRDLKEKEIISSEEVILRIREEIATLEALIAEQVSHVPYPEE